MFLSENNIMTITDGYKGSHYSQYPPNTEYIYSYLESRGGAFDEIVFHGLQYYCKKYLSGKVVTQGKLDEAAYYWGLQSSNSKFNYEGWLYILNKYDGVLPLIINAVEEGSVIPTKCPLMTVYNYDPKCWWLTNWLETMLTEIWYPCTVASNGWAMKKVILGYLNETGTPEDINYKLVDFGLRGVSSLETGGIGGCSHLVNFDLTDNNMGVIYANNYYNKLFRNTTIPASEHSTITSWGKEHEVDAMRNMLHQYPTGLMACVSDSFDIYNACANIWGGALKEEVLARDGVLIIRPDSGYPPEVVGKCLDILGDKFGYERNKKGYKVLHPKVRLLQGDGIDLSMLDSILMQMKYKNWSADNLTFGSGGGLLQKFDRDSCKFAFKCSAAFIDGANRAVFKDPVTDKGKTSKAGLLSLVKEDGKFVTKQDLNLHSYPGNLLKQFFINGRILKEQTLDEIRERASHYDRND